MLKFKLKISKLDTRCTTVTIQKLSLSLLDDIHDNKDLLEEHLKIFYPM